MDNGLVITDLGIQGLIVETKEPAYEEAKARHAQLQLSIDGMSHLSSGALLILRLICEGVVLHRATLDALAAVGRAQLYRCGDEFEVELSMDGRWLDRRQLPSTV